MQSGSRVTAFKLLDGFSALHYIQSGCSSLKNTIPSPVRSRLHAVRRVGKTKVSLQKYKNL